jgi:hypothetical protein
MRVAEAEQGVGDNGDDDEENDTNAREIDSDEGAAKLSNVTNYLQNTMLQLSEINSDLQTFMPSATSHEPMPRRSHGTTASSPQ